MTTLDTTPAPQAVFFIFIVVVVVVLVKGVYSDTTQINSTSS